MTEDGSKQNTSWHFADWPPLALLETVIKLFALLLAILTAYRAIARWTFEFPSGLQLIEWIILLVLSIGLAMAILDRIQNREILSMGFVLLNNLGHWGMTYAIATTPGPGSLVSIFALLMMIGDIIKLMFLRVNAYSVRQVPKAVLYGLTGFYLAGYAAIFVLEQLA